MALVDFILPNIVHLAAILTLVCFLFRDQIMLRSFAVAGDALFTIYYYAALDQPLWNALYWSVMNVIINLSMIAIILQDSKVSLLSDDEMNLFRNLGSLSPGQFRKLMKKGDWKKAEEAMTLTTEGEELDTLYYVLEGGVDINKAGRSFAIEPRQFIGELSFLRKKPATATVSLREGAHYVAWKHSDLHSIFNKNEDLRNAMNLLLSKDMAEKVANT